MSKIAVGVRVFDEANEEYATIKEVRGDNKFKVDWDNGTEGTIWWDRVDFVFVDEGPIRTVTRREIVEGQFGLVTVDRHRDQIVISISPTVGWNPNPDELEAAARILIELAEALRG